MKRLAPPQHTQHAILAGRIRQLETRVRVMWVFFCIGIIIGSLHLLAFVLNTVMDAKMGR